MRILFVVTGFGYGDTVRIKLLLEELKKRKNDLGIMFLGYDHSYDYFHGKYPTLKISGYNFPDSNMKFKTNRFLLKNFYLPVAWYKDYMRHKKKIQEFNPDIVISDFEPVANIIAKKLGKKCISIFGYDPNLFEKYPDKNKNLAIQDKYIREIYDKSDMVIVPAFKKKDDYGNVRYVSIMTDASQNRLASKSELMAKLKLKKEPIVVMLGGSNYGVNLAKSILKMSDIFGEDFIFFGSKKKIPGLHFRFAKNFLEYLKVSKAVITLAGKLTLSECLIFKKPMLVFPIENHIEQLMNAYSIRNISIKGDIHDIEGSIRNLLEHIKELESKMKFLDIKADGAEEAVNIILKEFHPD